MRKFMVTVALTAATLILPSTAALADEVPTDDLAGVDGLTAEQLEAIASFEEGGMVSVEADSGPASRAAVQSRRASYYRGSALMWARDNVDFGFDGSRVNWTSAFQQAGYIFPNIARNNGITKYVDTVMNDRFRASNTIGAGVVTPWGDVKVYSSDYIHRLSVNHNGAWSAWAD